MNANLVRNQAKQKEEVEEVKKEESESSLEEIDLEKETTQEKFKKMGAK